MCYFLHYKKARLWASRAVDALYINSKCVIFKIKLFIMLYCLLNFIGVYHYLECWFYLLVSEIKPRTLSKKACVLLNASLAQVLIFENYI